MVASAVFFPDKRDKLFGIDDFSGGFLLWFLLLMLAGNEAESFAIVSLEDL